MTDSSNASNHSLLSASDQESADGDSPPMAEDSEQPDVPQDSQLANSPEPPAPPDPSGRRGRNQSVSRQSMDSSQTRRVASKSRVAGQFHSPRASVPRPPTTNLSLLILTAVSTCQRKSGLSMQALKKIVTNMGYDMAKKKHYFLRSIKGLVAKGQLRQVKGTGATGSFKVNPDMGKRKIQPKVKGKGRQAKEAAKKKKATATSQRGDRNKTKKPSKETSRATKRNKMTPLSAPQSQVKV